MSSAPRKTKKKKQVKAEPVKKKEPEVVTCKLADNDYTGIIREGQLGAQYLDCANAHYTWQSGIKYDGPFQMSQIEGTGKFEWQDGSSYTGQLHGGKRHGQGMYVAKDGVTKYDGQWHMGKRHGEGKLTYSADGLSFYEGSWRDGKKNGEGKQVWTSLNSYVGQWEDSAMRGHGTMTWYNQGQVETYSGNWEDSQPHGEGTHTWCAPEPKPDQAFKDTTSQQLNNRYTGQWLKGTRHGKGTFYYANGAYYTGEWIDHVKQGKGRHVFEDGRVYDGPFENDVMTEFKAPEPVGLNFGNDDNPVRRMIDISDIQMFACPYDNKGLDSQSQASGLYVEPQKILREVYNLLLRSLGDLKELYYRYRVLLPVQGEDPFVLSAHQFWLLSRDCGLITPTCMLHRLDRSVFCGPRHHLEAAPDDVDEVRPVTPRPAEVQRASKRSVMDPDAEAEEDDEDEVDEGDHVSDEGTDPSGSGSPKEGGSPKRDNQGRTPSKEEMQLMPSEIPKTEFVDESLGAEEAEKGAENHAAGPRVARFRRSEDRVTNIHNPLGQLLFRQFVEGTVRLCLASFPCEKTLEVQAHRLFKEKIGPHIEGLRLSDISSSLKAFDFISDPEFVKVMGEFRPGLLVLFRGGVVSEEYDSPSWVGQPRADHSGSHIVRVRHYGDFAVPLHHYHVLARLDKTIRVKDAFRLLNSAGFMKGLSKGDVPWADLSKQMFAYAAEEDLLVIDEQEREAWLAAQESGSTTPSESDLGGRSLSGFGTAGGAGQSGGMSGFGGFGGQSGFGGLGAAGESDKKAKRNRRRKKGDDDEEQEGEEKKEGGSKPVVAAPTTAALADFGQCDFSITPLQALRLILECCSPGTCTSLYWHMDPARVSITHDTIGLLEFMESELIFAEFLRILIRMSDLGTRKDIPLCERLPAAMRFEGFLRHIFFPALRTPYVPPAPPADETEKGSDVARSAEAGEIPAGEAAEAENATGSNAGEEEPVEGIKDESLELVELWAGFDDYTCAEVEAHHATRRWPEGYEAEIASWV
jgi:hypothetical protein